MLSARSITGKIMFPLNSARNERARKYSEQIFSFDGETPSENDELLLMGERYKIYDTIEGAMNEKEELDSQIKEFQALLEKSKQVSISIDPTLTSQGSRGTITLHIFEYSDISDF